jgi:hypothetical protein
MHNISATLAATRWQKLAADLPSILTQDLGMLFAKYVTVSIQSFLGYGALTLE